MNAPLKHPAAYWGTKTDFAGLLAQVAKIGPVLEANATENDTLGRLNDATFAALQPLRMSHIFAGEDIGGAQLSPTQGLELIEAITYHSGAAGWVSMVHACIGAMSAAFLPDTAISRLFGGETDNRFSGQGTPTGMLKKTDGGYLLNGRWAYASGIYHATFTHTAALLDDGNGQPAKDENGDVIVLCAHAPVEEHDLLGNWDVLGLKATGSIDYGAKDVFIPQDMVFPILTAEPQRLKEFFSLGVVGLAAIGHSGWAIGASRRILDEMAKYARTKTGRAGLLGESDKFWFDFGRAEARVRAARALLFEVWRDVEASIGAGKRVSTRQISLVHLAKSEVHEAGVDACHFVYRAAGGASLRAGVMQRVYREMLTAANHFTINPNIVGAAGREIGGVWSDRAWQFYDLVEKKKVTSAEMLRNAAAPALSDTAADDPATVSEAFLTAFRHHPSGVAIITAETADGPAALTISSLISVSVAPPTVAFSLSDNSSSGRLLQQAETVVVHFVRRSDMQLARLCATSGAERFGPGVRWDRLPTGEPFYPQVGPVFRAAIRGRLRAPGASLVTAELIAVRRPARDSTQADSLVYADRTWHGLSPIADAVRTPLQLWPDDSATF